MFSRSITVLRTDPINPIPNYHEKELTAAVLSKIAISKSTLAQSIHDGTNAYYYGQRAYKPLVHSQFSGLVWNKEKKQFTAPGGHLILYVGWREDVVNAFIEGATKEPIFRVGSSEMNVISSTTIPLCYSNNIFHTVSPVVASRDGKCVLYKDRPAEFLSLLEDNLKRKYEAIFGKPVDRQFKVRAPKGLVSVAVGWGDFIVLGNRGCLQIESEDPTVTEMAYAVGVGTRNALGFGMLAA